MLADVINSWGPAILGGLIGGGFAVILLRRTQRNEAAIRAEALQREKAAAVRRRVGYVMVEVRALADAICSHDLRTCRRASANRLSNQITFANLDGLSEQAVDDVRRFVEAANALLDWLHSATGQEINDLGRTDNLRTRQWRDYQSAIARWVEVLERRLGVDATGDGSRPSFPLLPELRPFADHAI